MTVIGSGQSDTCLSDPQIVEIIEAAAGRIDPAGKRILVIIPDHTRSCPLGAIVRGLRKSLGERADKLDFLIALGTHQPLDYSHINSLLDIEPGHRGQVLGDSEVFNHDWKNRDALTTIGTLTADRIREITGGTSAGFELDIDVTINKRIFDYDLLMVAGPVFPHEVAGFSGGAKYFFPGICGPELLNFFHWLGALITIPKMIGCKNTPVRATLDAAVDMISQPTCLLAMVVKGRDLAGLYFGDIREAWSAAADLSSEVHITYADRPYDSVLSRAPTMYDELWVGAKCMYKMESVVADGGELIVYAPHITEIAEAHGEVIRQVGYHTLEYFLKQWDRFKDYPWGVLAHSTHVRGIGSYADGVETPRINVTLATGIPENLCREINLGYRDPADIDISYWADAEDQGRLYVPKAGEMLYRLKNPPDWAKP
ncbi:MAG: lactate racemase domain-containing protein [Phycisphaerae bacterium]|jgi:nickel-dependent lactate racemase|nr:lactate racemase domain-containing protein [Phycisphaerae bacterium]